MIVQTHSPWQTRLRERLFEQPYPLWIDNDGILPAASLWYAVRERLSELRSHNVQAGDRVVLALPPQRTLLEWMFAALWQGCTVALAPQTANGVALGAFFDAVCVVSSEGAVFTQSGRIPPTPDISFLLASSGTSGAQRWYALSAENVFSVIDSHLPALNLFDNQHHNGSTSNFVSNSISNSTNNFASNSTSNGYSAARVLSLLPLHHAFGLVIDFFMAFFAGAEIVRDGQNGRDTAQILALAEEHHITHCSMVPLLARRLAAHEEGRRMLRGLQGGVIGGAPVHAALADFLATTRLRVGYGQTEASPGITLGEAGAWCEGYIGTPLGCETRINADGVLEFRGKNLHIGRWTEQGFVRRRGEEWFATNDYVQTIPQAPSNQAPSNQAPNNHDLPGYIFIGRADDTFKLANGRFIPAPHWEALLKSRIAGCTEAMICSLDEETCSIALLNEAPQIPHQIKGLKHEVSVILEIPVELVSNVCLLTSQQWMYTPKGSTDRKALQTLLLSVSTL
ncbi:MAG: acyl--CoA ligase [Candidatus Kapabacteria bacterium]|jgi:acyl-CoA synthetase (AMP-forming)/AMP-acid ligase II|nr:acyl--CoA ligase [Candidatus Kapabacteria bacterium]